MNAALELPIEPEREPPSGPTPPRSCGAAMFSPPAWRIVAPLAAVLALSSAADLFFFTGYFASDDRSYFNAALQILETGAHPSPSLGGMRLTIVGWNLLVVLLFGPHVQIVAASYVVFHQLVVVMTFLLARRLLDGRAGLLAAYLTGVFPLIVTFSTMILPDVMLTLFCMMALLNYLASRELRVARPVAAWWLFFASGACVGLGYMTKETALVLLPFFFLAWLTTIRRSAIRASLVHGSAFAIGFFVVFALEYGALSYLAGRSFLRLGWTMEPLPADVQAAVNLYGFTPAERLGWVQRRLPDEYWPDPMKLAVVAALLAFPLWPRRCFSVPLMGLWLFAALTFGSMNFMSYVPTTIHTRYFVPLVPIAMALVATLGVGLFDLIFRRGLLGRRGTRRAAAGVAVALLLLSGASAMRGPDRLAGKHYRADVVRNTADALVAARRDDDGGRVVLSATLGDYYRPLNGPWSDAIADTASLDDAAVSALLDSRRFFYVELPRDSMLRQTKWLRMHGLDRLIWPVLADYLHPVNLKTPRVIPTFRRVDASGAGQVRWEGNWYELTVRPLGRFDQAASRTRRVLASIFRMPGGPPRSDRESVGVALYEVTVQPIGAGGTVQSARDAATTRPEQATAATRPAKTAVATRPGRVAASQPTPAPVWDIAATMREWRDKDGQRSLRNWSTGKGDVCEIQERAGGDWTLHSSLTGRRYAWLRPDRSFARKFRFEAERRYAFEIDAEIGGGLQVEFVLSPMLPPGSAAGFSRVLLHDGPVELRFCAGPSAVAYEPMFKLIGKGTLSVRSFRIVTVD